MPNNRCGLSLLNRKVSLKLVVNADQEIVYIILHLFDHLYKPLIQNSIISQSKTVVEAKQSLLDGHFTAIYHALDILRWIFPRQGLGEYTLMTLMRGYAATNLTISKAHRNCCSSFFSGIVWAPSEFQDPKKKGGKLYGRCAHGPWILRADWDSQGLLTQSWANPNVRVPNCIMPHLRRIVSACNFSSHICAHVISYECYCSTWKQLFSKL